MPPVQCAQRTSCLDTPLQDSFAPFQCLIAAVHILVLERLLLPLGATVSLTSPVKWPDRVFETSLCCLVSQNPAAWSRHLIWIEYAHNNLPCSSSGLSPLHCAYGYKPPLFPVLEEEVSVPSAQALIRRYHRIWSAACQILLQSSVQESVLVPASRPPPLPRFIDHGPMFTVKWLLAVRQWGLGH